MTDRPNRCAHCWAALPEAATDFCPHCGRSVVAAKAPRRQWRSKAPDAPGAPTAPPAEAPPATYTPYDPYVPLGSSGAPAPAPSPAPASPLSAPAAVAVLERDPLEFPGRPLPPGFFDALPERARRAPTGASRKFIVVGVVVGGMVLSSVGRAVTRSEAVDSPARYLVAGACAEYRDFTTRLDRNGDDVEALQDGIVWFQTNRERFVEAARLDPELQGAADFVVWFGDVIDADFAPMDGMSDSEIDEREEPLSQACFVGAGRA